MRDWGWGEDDAFPPFLWRLLFFCLPTEGDTWDPTLGGEGSWRAFFDTISASASDCDCASSRRSRLPGRGTGQCLAQAFPTRRRPLGLGLGVQVGGTTIATSGIGSETSCGGVLNIRSFLFDDWHACHTARLGTSYVACAHMLAQAGADCKVERWDGGAVMRARNGRPERMVTKRR